MTRDELKARFPRWTESFLRANLPAGDTGPTAKLESNPGNAALGTEEVQGQDCGRFLVRVTSRRKRLLDEDNLCEKYHVDLCRYAGVIPDDSPEQLKIEVSQTKCRKGEEEIVVIEVWEMI